MASGIRHIIFDLDGTLIDSAPSILAGFEGALNIHGIAPVVPLTDKLIGPPLKDTLSRLTGITDPEKIQALAESFKAYYDATGFKASGVYPGIPAMLEALSRLGFRLHIATNKRLNPTLKILDYFGWASWFDQVYALDKQTPAYANKGAMLAGLMATHGITAAEALYVGDKAEDGEAAGENQLPFVAVAWGYGNFTGEEPGWTLVHEASQLVDLVQAH